MTRRLDPHTRDRRQPLEILARLAGRSTFVLRAGAPGGTPITALDVAHALATADDPLGQAVGMAMACQRPLDWPLVHRLGYPRLLRDLQTQRERPGIVAGARRYRARLALYDGFRTLLAPHHDLQLESGAAECRCAPATYAWLVRRAAAMLEHAASSAAADACRFLFAAEQRAPEPVPVTQPEGCPAPAAEPADTAPQPVMIDREELALRLLQRERRPRARPVLTLRGRRL